MTDDIDPTTLPDDTRDEEADPGPVDPEEEIEGADEAEDGGDAAAEALNEEEEDEE